MPADVPIPDHPTPRPTLGERVRAELRVRHYSARTERAYLDWIRRYWLFCNRRDPEALSAPQVEAFLIRLATVHQVAASGDRIRAQRPGFTVEWQANKTLGTRG